MKKKQTFLYQSFTTITEEMFISVNIFRWVCLAVIIGAMVGCVSVLFLKLLSMATLLIQGASSFYYLCLPLVLFIAALITTYISPDSQGHGTEKVIAAIHRNNGNIRLRVVPVKLFITIFTIAFGGSAGKEGPCAQIGASLSSAFAKFFKFSSEDKKKLVICGISAGFAAVFGTPIAGAIFGVEVLFVGNILYSVLLPSFIAGMVSFQVASMLGVQHHYYSLALTGEFDLFFLFKCIIAGILFGLVSFCFVELMKFTEKQAKLIPIWTPFKGVIGGTLLIGIALIFSIEYLGLGIETIDHALSGKSIVWYAFLIKIFATCITLSFGGSGGVLTPLFFVGATSGVCIGHLLGIDPVICAAFGLISVLAGAANTPLAACVLGVELFGSAVTPYATICCVISFFMTGYRSIFPSQVLSSQKSPHILVKQGEEIEHFETHYDYKTRKAMASGRHFAKKIFNHKSH